MLGLCKQDMGKCNYRVCSRKLDCWMLSTSRPSHSKVATQTAACYRSLNMRRSTTISTSAAMRPSPPTLDLVRSTLRGGALRLNGILSDQCPSRWARCCYANCSKSAKKLPLA